MTKRSMRARTGATVLTPWAVLMRPLWPLLFAAMACSTMVTMFAVLADEALDDGVDGYDPALSRAIHGAQAHELTEWLRLATWLGGTTATWLLCLGLAGWLALVARRPRASALVLGSWVGGQIAVAIIKQVLERARPDLVQPLVHADGYSFPSAHTFSAIVGYGLIAAVVAASLRDRRRFLPWSLAALLVVVIGYSRIYLGAHFPADVLGSLLLGSSWLYATLVVIRFAEAPHHFRPAWEECRAHRRATRAARSSAR